MLRLAATSRVAIIAKIAGQPRNLSQPNTCSSWASAGDLGVCKQDNLGWLASQLTQPRIGYGAWDNRQVVGLAQGTNVRAHETHMRVIRALKHGQRPVTLNMKRMHTRAASIANC
jgi:hypothetical protein